MIGTITNSTYRASAGVRNRAIVSHLDRFPPLPPVARRALSAVINVLDRRPGIERAGSAGPLPL